MDWFPRLRAISLAVEDVDGEQNEWKTLQGQVRKMNTVTLGLQLFWVIPKNHNAAPTKFLIGHQLTPESALDPTGSKALPKEMEKLCK